MGPLPIAGVDPSETVGWLGWAGVLAFVAVLPGYLALWHYGVRWVFGPAAGQGGRVVVGAAAAAVLLGAGGAVWAVAAGSGEAPGWLVRVARGGGCALALGACIVLVSARRPEPD